MKIEINSKVKYELLSCVSSKTRGFCLWLAGCLLDVWTSQRPWYSWTQVVFRTDILLGLTLLCSSPLRTHLHKPTCGYTVTGQSTKSCSKDLDPLCFGSVWSKCFKQCLAKELLSWILSLGQAMNQPGSVCVSSR